MLRAIPPAPIAALRDQQLFVGKPAIVFGNAGCQLIVFLTSAEQILPGLVVFLRSDPDVEVGVNPRSREDMMERPRTIQLQSLADGERHHVERVANAPV